MAFAFTFTKTLILFPFSFFSPPNPSPSHEDREPPPLHATLVSSHYHLLNRTPSLAKSECNITNDVVCRSQLQIHEHATPHQLHQHLASSPSCPTPSCRRNSLPWFALPHHHQICSRRGRRGKRAMKV